MGAKPENKQQTLQDLFALRDLFKAGGWTQRYFFVLHTKEGYRSCIPPSIVFGSRVELKHYYSGDDVCMCLVGGMRYVTGDDAMRVRYLCNAMGFTGPNEAIAWNDNTNTTVDLVRERIHTAIVETEARIL